MQSLPFRSAEIGGPSEVADGLNLVFDHNEFGQDKVKTSSDGTDFSRFEQLLKGKTFSKEEINHLLEILNSRVDMEGEKKNPSGEDAERVLLTQEIPRTPVEERQDTNRPIIGTPIQKSDFTRSPKIPRTPLEREQEDRDRLIGTSLQKADVKDAIGASPVDIAQAYMGSCTSERGHDPYSFMSKSRRAQQFSNEFATKPIMPPPSPKPSICWPGAEVHDGRGYVTPQSQRGRYGHFDFPRTPYSRTIASKSRDKADSKFQNRSSTPFQQAHTSIYGQEKWGDAVDSYGSVGPIHRIRNKFASEVRPRGSIFHKSSIDAHPEMVKSTFSEGLLPSTETKLERGETSSASKYMIEEPAVGGSESGFKNLNQSSSSEAARKILEHLDRNKPTHKEKAAELKLATTWRKTPDEASDTVPKANVSSLQFGELGSHKNTSFVSQKIPREFKNDSSNASFPVQFQEKGGDEVNGNANENAKASNTGVLFPSKIPGSNEIPTFGFKKTFDPQVKNLDKKSFVITSNGQKEMTNLTGLVPSKDQSTLSHGKKSIWPSISIGRPNPYAVSSDNGRGFTFPVSASSGFLSEPPTPSIVPSSSTIAPSQPKDVTAAVPFYSFGTNKSTRLVFSFPSTSSISEPDACDLKVTVWIR
ncbi:Hypothetical predicted protein [Olea europaea subsp. europaea]|uniref:Uncharacterized protein n=1 Tax=Olea europaea subsp. europaea TaxID=158383 RepID=A0A8S0TUD3_OLEEU|nr:Hypothetical predicted protein [Olea europaea subsp. europaea]